MSILVSFSVEGATGTIRTNISDFDYETRHNYSLASDNLSLTRLLNMILGVVVENTLAMQRSNEDKVRNQQEKDHMKVLNHLKEVFETADEDGSGSPSP